MPAAAPGPSLLTKATYVTGLLIFGSLNTITMKIAFCTKSVGSSSHEESFHKPWFITFVMFVAMSLALPFDKDMRRRCCGTSKGTELQGAIDQAPLLAANGNGNKSLSWGRKVVMVAPAAVFDILATGLCSMGFVYIPSSVWQLLRGAEMVFAKIFGSIFLKQESYAFHWVGVLLCSMGIVLVGLASVWGESSQVQPSGKDASVGSALVLMGMGMALAGQVVQALQVTAEEHLLKECDLPELQIVGFEGVWGGLIMLPVLVACYYVPGSDNGAFEDELDTADMLMANGQLAALILLYTFSCSTYNMAGIAVTGALTAVHRVMIEALRTSIVWAFGLIVHSMNPESAVGEAWTDYSPLEVGGFVLIIVGQGVYGAMLRLPGLRYPPDLEDVMPSPSPGALRNLSAAMQVHSPSRGLSGSHFASPGGVKSSENPTTRSTCGDDSVHMTIDAGA